MSFWLIRKNNFDEKCITAHKFGHIAVTEYAKRPGAGEIHRQRLREGHRQRRRADRRVGLCAGGQHGRGDEPLWFLLHYLAGGRVLAGVHLHRLPETNRARDAERRPAPERGVVHRKQAVGGGGYFDQKRRRKRPQPGNVRQ